MSHAQSLLFPHLTFSAHSATSPTSIPLLLLFPSHGDDHTLTSYEPNDLSEMNNTEVAPTFFHRQCVTSTYDSVENIATPLQNQMWTVSK